MTQAFTGKCRNVCDWTIFMPVVEMCHKHLLVNVEMYVTGLSLCLL